MLQIGNDLLLPNSLDFHFFFLSLFFLFFFFSFPFFFFLRKFNVLRFLTSVDTDWPAYKEKGFLFSQIFRF